MNITGIIAEYNPFHNGHLYQLERARTETAADYIVVVLSGDFVQRGAPAIIDKYTRTQMALCAGADLVLELPVCYAASSAEYFAAGAVSLLDKLGCISQLSFGSECGDVKKLMEIAAINIEETPAYKDALNRYLKQGIHFAQANAKAVSAQFADATEASLAEELLKSPNNTLGIAYLKALRRRNSSIQPHAVKRQQSDYHDTTSGALSATAVRHALLSSSSDLLTPDKIQELQTQLPDYALTMLTEAYQKSFPIWEDDFSELLLYRLRSLFTEAAQSHTAKSEIAGCLAAYADVSEELSCRIYATINQFTDFSQFCLLLKTKEMTYSRISRALLHILLDIKKSRLDAYVQDDYLSYARILGFRKAAAPLFSEIKAHSDILLISKLADARELLLEADNGQAAYQMLLADIYAADLYEQTACRKYRQPFQSEYSREIIRI